MSRISLRAGTEVPGWSWWHTLYPDLAMTPGNATFPCIFHDETNGESLSLRVLPNGSVLFNCFSPKCGDDLLEKVLARWRGTEEPEATSPATPPNRRAIVVQPGQTLTPIEALASYTGVAQEALKLLDLREVGQALEFVWPGKKLVKIRRLPYESKNFEWSPSKAGAPPFWPAVPDELPDDIFITEGETDCIVLLSLDVPAFALTKGAETPLQPELFEELKARGAKTVFLIPDVDEAGRKSATRISRSIEEAGLEARVIGLGPHLRVMDGEKDLRELYLRVGRDGLLAVLETAYASALADAVEPRWASDILGEKFEADWLVPGMVARGSITLLSGQPKAGKTTFTMKLVDALHGGSILNRVCKKARVLYLTENRKISLQTKLAQVRNPSNLLVIDRYRHELLPLDWADTCRAVFEIAQRHKVDVIILDTFMAWAQPEDENSSAEIQQALDPLSRNVEKTGIALVVVHHLNKEGGSPRGSGVFQAECDTIVNISHAKNGARRLSVVSALLPTQPDDITFVYEDGRYRIVEEVLDPFDEVILATLNVLAVPTTLAELQPELDPPFNTRSTDTLRLRLNKLVETGKVLEEKSGKPNEPTRYSAVPEVAPTNISVRRTKEGE